MPSNPDLEALASGVLAEVKTGLGDAWAKLGDDAKALIQEVARDAARLGARQVAGNPAPASELAQIDAQLAGIKAVGVKLTRDTLMRAAASAFSKAAAALLAAV